MSSDTNTAAIPVAVEDVQGDQRWQNMHDRYVNEAKEKEPEILFVGDSLIQLMTQYEVWTDLFEPLHTLNFGIGGDQTQHVLWRLQNGALDNIKPKVIVLLVGTNNHEHTADQVFEGIETIIEYITTKIPEAQLIVMAIPPRGQHPNKLRDKIKSINGSLESLLGARPPKYPKAEYFDANNDFVIDGGTICQSDMYDYLHLTNQGYRRICEPLRVRLDELLQGK